mmetsp:Transcript_26062/g.65149  ORF Transcript_26062/g.65149 Transcript_26062/m.65149 type:complete len:205 (-) Transcript_26062:835-1449(-)
MLFFAKERKERIYCYELFSLEPAGEPGDCRAAPLVASWPFLRPHFSAFLLLPSASAAFSALNTSSATTFTGSLCTVSSGTHVLFATIHSFSSLTSPLSPTSASVVGSPTSSQNPYTSSMSSFGFPVRISPTCTPIATFSPCMNAWHSSSSDSPLCTACAAPSPPLSKPTPLSSVFASTTRSKSGVATPARAATTAPRPLESRVL